MAPGRPLAADGGLHRAQGAGPGLRRLRRHRRRRRRHRPHPRRRADRVRLLALDPAHQRAHRRRGRRGRLPLRLGEPGLGQPRLRPPRRRHRHRRPAGPRLRLHQGRHRRLELLDHRHPVRRGRRAAGGLRRHRAAGQPTRSCPCGSSSTATGAGRSWPRCWWARRMLGTFLSLTYYFQGDAALLGPQDRLRLRALLPRHHHRRHRGQPAAAPLRAPGAPDRRAPHGRRRPGPLQHPRRALHLR